MLFRGEPTTRTVDLANWCRRYVSEGPYPCDAVYRYGIGIYQIAQGVDWAGTVSAGEGYAAACIHFLIATEQLNIEVCSKLPRDLKEIETGQMYNEGWKRLLRAVSHAQRQITYSRHFRNNTSAKWRSRWKPDELGGYVAEAITLLMSMISKDKRLEAIELAMEEMLPQALKGQKGR